MFVSRFISSVYVVWYFVKFFAPNTYRMPVSVSTALTTGVGAGRSNLYGAPPSPRFSMFTLVASGVKNGKSPYTLSAG